jgi:DNA-directed RNA polymerase specialized sigma subunit
MMLCIEMLSEQDRLLIYNLFFKGKSERQLSAETGIPQRTINDRKRKILLELKKLIES